MRWSAAAVFGLCAAAPMALMLAAQQPKPGVNRDRAAMNGESKVPAVIVTAAPVYDSLAALRGQERFPRGARLMIVRDGQMAPLVPDFAASADASVSFDGKAVLFAGRKTAADPWQIWEVAVAGGAPRLVSGGATDRIRPFWMAEERLAYARRDSGGFVLESAALDGSHELRLSHAPGNFVPDDVLRDGRVLFESGFPLGAGKTPEMYLVYADGSGVESVRCDHPAAGGSTGREHGRQMANGDIVFTHGLKLGRFTSALADEAPIAAPAGEYAGDVAGLPDGRRLLAMREAGEKHYGLAVWKPGSSRVAFLVRDAGNDLIEPVVVGPRVVPNRHPSALHPWTTGNLLALDARLTRGGRLHGAPRTVRVETLNDAGQLVRAGEAPVENDGSFFVQARGDRPLRFILLDAAGRTIGQEQGWFWVRGGEQRICVGCHTGPERAPDNRVPEVLLRSTTPVDVTGGVQAPAGGGH